MAYDVEALLGLWEQTTGSPDEDAERFRAVYTDPVVVNGQPLTAHDLAVRAAVVRAAFDEVGRELLDQIESADGTRVVIAFCMSGRQVGPLPTPQGVLEPTGEPRALRIIDILTLDQDRKIAAITMMAEVAR
jgi:hypothetical protein